MSGHFSFEETGMILRHVRVAEYARRLAMRALPAEKREHLFTVTEALEIIERVVASADDHGIEDYIQKAMAVKRAEMKSEPTLRRLSCLVHKERRFVFKDGSVMESCEHDLCGFVKTTKRHSDGVSAGGYDFEPIEQDDSDYGSSLDDTQELMPPPKELIAGEDEVQEDEVPEQEFETESEILEMEACAS